MKGYLVNPRDRLVTEIDVPLEEGALQLSALYPLMGVDWVDAVMLPPTLFGSRRRVVAIVDDNGLLHKDQAFTLVSNQPLAGTFAIFCETGDGTVEPDFTVQAVEQAVRFVTERFARATIEQQTIAAAAAYVAHGHRVQMVGDGVLFVTDPRDDAQGGA